jgi:hypothetical protein
MKNISQVPQETQTRTTYYMIQHPISGEISEGNEIHVLKRYLQVPCLLQHDYYYYYYYFGGPGV